jgi:hypothetical protein
VGASESLALLFRWLLNAAAVVSLLICIVIGICWPRSYYAYMWVGYTWQDGRWFSVKLERGWASVAFVEAPKPLTNGSGVGCRFDTTLPPGWDAASGSLDPERFSIAMTEEGPLHWWLPIHVERGKSLESVVLHDWTILFLAALLPGFRAFSRVRKRIGSDGQLCRKCGYDLRATRERCPECGTIARPGQMEDVSAANRETVLQKLRLPCNLVVVADIRRERGGMDSELLVS